MTRRILFLLLLANCSPLFAHDTFLVAIRGTVDPGSVATLHLTSGMAFPTLDYAIKPERVERAACRVGGTTSKLSPRRPAPHSLSFQARLAAAGVAVCWVELKPKTLELSPEKVVEYFEEIDPPAAVRQAWDSAGPDRHWRETYVKHAKTYLRAGRPGADRSWAEPAGMFLEIVPQSDPTALRAGDELPVQVLKGGKPLAGFAVALVRAGSPKAVFQSTDSEGRTRFKLPGSGRYLLRGTDLRPADKARRPGNDWESDFTTLSFEVP